MQETMPVDSGERFTGGSPFRQLWQHVKRQIVDDVPEESAICHFDCRKRQCTQAEWATCERRISKGAGELFPATEAVIRN
jgi:hypothetical protein